MMRRTVVEMGMGSRSRRGEEKTGCVRGQDCVPALRAREIRTPALLAQPASIFA
jgi:hypothetical protein